MIGNHNSKLITRARFWQADFQDALCPVAEQLINASSSAKRLPGQWRTIVSERTAIMRAQPVEWRLIGRFVARDYALFASRHPLRRDIYVHTCNFMSRPGAPRPRTITVRVISPVVKGCNEAESSSASFAKGLRLDASERARQRKRKD